MSGLLLDCVRAFVASDSSGQTQVTVPQGEDWESLFRTASRHGVTPVVSWVLANADPDTVPEAHRVRLRESLRANALHNLTLAGELLSILNLLESRGIAAVPFKGPVLAVSVYGNLALRDFCDLDILIRNQDVRRTIDLLVGCGYRTDLASNPAEEAAYLRSRYEIHFTPPRGDALIEIHRAFVPEFCCFPLTYESLAPRLRRVSLCGTEVAGIAPEDLLLILSVHGAKHAWSTLGWICDVARLVSVQANAIDWDTVHARARQLGVERLLALALFLANSVLGAALPAEVLNRCRADKAVNSLTCEVRHRLFSESGGSLSEFQSHWFFIKTRELISDKFEYCRRLAFTLTEEDYRIVSLPAFLSPLYYPLRAVRIFGKYGMAPLQRLF